MHPLIQLKTTPPLLITLTLLCFALLPKAQAQLSPPPDGDYPGQNTAEGAAALFGLTSGTYNTAVGWLSLNNVDTGNYNTAVGAGALFANSADRNTATGAGALVSNFTGTANTANGAFALYYNSAEFNTAIGEEALANNATGSQNTALGQGAGLIRRLVLAMCISAQGCWALLARVTPATSKAFSDKRLSAESRSSLTHRISLVR